MPVLGKRARGASHCPGISLIETLVAVFILTVGILALSGMFPTSAFAVSDARNTYSATELAREKLEYWLQQGYATIVKTCSGGNGTSATLDSGSTDYTDTSNGQTTTWVLSYQVQCTVLAAGEIQQVDSMVSWHQKGAAGGSLYLNWVRLDSAVINGWQTP